ncbi:winged helix-turn-helix domain-containing protein [Streptomyces sp. NPDC058614]|uniref:winged helix-turn-helix domain-containing protein n=1 Tax=Streptomyces sp. NPDC058614 TaxID=3346557 RepID=UPI0036602AAB
MTQPTRAATADRDADPAVDLRRRGQTPALSRATRRIIVRHLTDRSMTPADIAAELGISPDTVRRDLAATPEPAPAAAPPPAAGLLLPESTQLRDDVDLLAAAFKAQPEDAARFAIHQLAQHMRRRRTAASVPREAPEA